ncbi:MAG TPA: hypothetical protein VEW67_08935 [Thermoleophilaceae bacterium]|nr:hypothetical protein [Thermoleophilaceae bacterium]
MLPAALVVLALLVPTQVAGASVLAVQQDCGDSDVFEQKHSRADLQKALAQMQADLAEYGTCKQMITAALAAMAKTDAAKGSGGGGPGAATADLDGDGVVTPEEKAVAAKQAKEKRKQRNQEIAAVSDELVQDDAGTATGGGSGGTSLPMILAILALVCAGIGGGVWYTAKRNPAFANALRRVSPPFGNS